VIVADTNLIVYFVVQGASTSQAERVRAKDKEWVVPRLHRYEVLNVLTDHVRRGILTKDEALRASRRAGSLVTVSEVDSDPAALLAMWEASGCTTYDLEYVWLAKELDVPLVTADGAVLRAYPGVAISIAGFTGA